MHDFGKVLEFASVDVLVGPGQMIAGSYGCILWILLQQLCLHVVHNGSAEEDAHGALASGEEVQLLLLRHRCASFPSSEDDGLGPFRNGKLASKLSCSC